MRQRLLRRSGFPICRNASVEGLAGKACRAGHKISEHIGEVFADIASSARPCVWPPLFLRPQWLERKEPWGRWGLGSSGPRSIWILKPELIEQPALISPMSSHHRAPPATVPDRSDTGITVRRPSQAP